MIKNECIKAYNKAMNEAISKGYEDIDEYLEENIPTEKEEFVIVGYYVVTYQEEAYKQWSNNIEGKIKTELDEKISRVFSAIK